jgi:hypothetical protein
LRAAVVGALELIKMRQALLVEVAVVAQATQAMLDRGLLEQPTRAAVVVAVAVWVDRVARALLFCVTHPPSRLRLLRLEVQPRPQLEVIIYTHLMILAL